MTTPITSTALFGAVFLAISATQGFAACLNPSASLESIGQFRANPQGLVAPGSDTRTIEGTTRDLAGTDASLVGELIRVAAGTAPRFQTAIAAGLAQAAIACSTVDEQAAQLIQQAVAGFQDGQFQAAFAAVAGDLSTAATEAANASAASSVGSVVVVNPNTSSRSTLRPGGGGGVSALIQISSPSVGNLGSPSSTAAGPVSPTR
ncbi:hypothetical protein [Bradyrhizobium sp. sBnM-33]|uniref:hypothetical protein n=1 Tax=Bradyrhizobium sp. sBnM-33 TaxID=2831780 RepID=UPI001BCDAA92|nr:hypothetical protein [Bradyrhizobium sp. sBnM-33]WOH53651.1 hypothetical protein RX328_17125 [Bradyrhizobium sp. sBnM-33]